MSDIIIAEMERRAELIALSVYLSHWDSNSNFKAVVEQIKDQNTSGIEIWEAVERYELSDIVQWIEALKYQILDGFKASVKTELS